MTEDEPPLISSSELGRKLGLSRRTISLYAKNGQITPVLVTPGGQYRWRYEDVVTELQELARQQRQQRD